MGFTEDIQQAEWNLQQANATYRSRVQEAEKYVMDAQRAYENKVTTLERKTKYLKKPIASFRKIKLYADHVTDGKIKIFLQKGVNAHVKVGGNAHSVLVNNRRIILTIDSPEGARIVVVDNQTSEKRMHEFAARIMNTAAQIEGEPVPTDVRRAQLERELAVARADMREIATAQAARTAALNDTAAVRAAEQALANLRACVPQAEVATYEGAKQKRLRDRTIVIVVVVVLSLVALVLLGFIGIGLLFR